MVLVKVLFCFSSPARAFLSLGPVEFFFSSLRFPACSYSLAQLSLNLTRFSPTLLSWCASVFFSYVFHSVRWFSATLPPYRGIAHGVVLCRTVVFRVVEDGISSFFTCGYFLLSLSLSFSFPLPPFLYYFFLFFPLGKCLIFQSLCCRAQLSEAVVGFRRNAETLI